MPPIIIAIAPTITGNIKNWNDTPPIITIIGFAPAGGCVILNAIISMTPMPTAKPIVIKETPKKVINKIPTSVVSEWPKKTFFGWANWLSWYPKTITVVAPKDASYQRPSSVW